MSSISPKLSRVRLDPASHECLSHQSVTPRWLAVSIVRHDVNLGSPPQGISQPLGGRLRRESDHGMRCMPYDPASRVTISALAYPCARR
jgi:hypothetical protein